MQRFGSDHRNVGRRSGHLTESLKKLRTFAIHGPKRANIACSREINVYLEPFSCEAKGHNKGEISEYRRGSFGLMGDRGSSLGRYRGGLMGDRGLSLGRYRGYGRHGSWGGGGGRLCAGIRIMSYHYKRW